jgi:hypothetical protein
MSKKKMHDYEVGSAAFVVAHAQWKKSRGRGPSMSYLGIKNPRKALALALKEINTPHVNLTFDQEWSVTVNDAVIGQINLDYQNQVETVTLFGRNPKHWRMVKELALSHAIQFVIRRSPIKTEILALAPERELSEYTCDNLMSFDKIPEAIKLLDDKTLDQYLRDFANVVDCKFISIGEMLESLIKEVYDYCGVLIGIIDLKRTFMADVVLTFYCGEPNHSFKIWKSCESSDWNGDSRLHLTPPYHPVMLDKESYCLINGDTNAYIGGSNIGIKNVYAPEEARTEGSLFGSWSSLNHPFYTESKTLSLEICPTISISEVGYEALLGFLLSALNYGKFYVSVSGGFRSPYDYPSNVLNRKKIKSPTKIHGSSNCRGSEHDCVWQYQTLEAEGQLAGALIPSWFHNEGWLTIYEDEKGAV